jgi:hypothetical protein
MHIENVRRIITAHNELLPDLPGSKKNISIKNYYAANTLVIRKLRTI